MYKVKINSSDRQIINFMKEHNNKWMSTRHISDYVGIHQRTALESCKRMINAGIFEHTTKPIPNHQGFIHETDLYRLSTKVINER